MTTKVIIKNQKILSETKVFLSQYLAKKNRIDNELYLSFYLSEENHKTTDSRGLRFVKILRAVELTLKNQLNPKLAQVLREKLNSLSPFDVVKDSNMSIAFFVSENFAGFMFVPFPIFENIVVAQSLHLKPILSWVKSEDQFYLITLSSKLCRLLKGDSFSLKEVSSVSLKKTRGERVKNLNDKNVKLKLLAEAQEQFYQYVKNDNIPIIIGGVDELHDLYISLSRDSDLLKERIIGNLDRINFQEIHHTCMEILSVIRHKNDQEVLDQFKEMKPYGKVVEELNEITIAAIQGRIQNLMIASDRFLWGSLDKVTGRINTYINKNQTIPEDDILDDLAEIVIARGGSVTLLKHYEMPSDSEAIALLR